MTDDRRAPDTEQPSTGLQAAEESQRSMRGALRVYLGAAPGVGKTYAMLNEGQRRKARGTDVVIGYVETYNRPLTVKAAEGLEVVPRRTGQYRGTVLEEMDGGGGHGRSPTVALNHQPRPPHRPGSKHEKR